MALHFSDIKVIATSPAHYRYAKDNPRPSTPDMQLGIDVHHAVFGTKPDTDTAPKPLVYEGKRQGNAWEEFKAAHPDVEIITIAEFERALEEIEARRVVVQRIADAVTSDRRVREILEGAEVEKKLTGTLHGRAVEGRADILSKTRGIWDLKVTFDAHPARFLWQARRMHYPVQVTWYGDLAESMGLEAGAARGLIAVEKRAPHCVTVHELTPELIDMSRRQYIGWIEMLNVCESADSWPGYSEAVLPMGPIESESDFIFEEAAE